MPPLQDRHTNMQSTAKPKKRSHDVIDLTEDDQTATYEDERPTKRIAADLSDGTITHSESERDSWLTDDGNIDEDVPSSQSDQDTSNLRLYGYLSSRVVGCQYYKGLATVDERIVLRREPKNPYDNNAIRVDNTQMNQIGHIPRAAAGKLAKYLDNGWLAVEGKLAGMIAQFDAPLTLELLGPADPDSEEGKALLDRMKADKLPLNIIKDAMKQKKKAEQDRLKAEKAALAEARRVAAGVGGKGLASDGDTKYANRSQPGLTTDMAEIMEKAERFDPRRAGDSASYGQDEDALKAMPKAKQPQAIKTNMLPYQLQALQWLLDQEDAKPPAEGSKDTIQLWKRHTKNKNAFTNIATGHSTETVPEMTHGGILADDMGLGKTLEMISLIVADQEKNGKSPTLIIAPLSVMSNWTDQMARHVHQKHALSPYIYHGKQALPMKPDDLSQYDVVITTYQTLASDYGKGNTESRKTGLYSVDWRRIVLDEGHIVRNPNSKGAAAVRAVKAKMRWVLTGTPIVNTLKDLYSLLKFIRIQGGLEHLEIFNSVLTRPLNAGDASAVFLLKAVMKAFALRRKKEMEYIDLKLPPLEEYIQRLDFTDNERKRYTVLEDEAHGAMKAYMKKADTINKMGSAFQVLLEILLRMRQCCNHWQLCGERVSKLMAELSEQKVVSLTPENVKGLQDILQVRIESQDECAICLETLHQPVITHCGHSFGRSCIERTIETQHKCPMCRAELPDDSYLVETANDCGDEAVDEMDASGSSSKIQALMKILAAIKNEGKGEKTIIFSQWTSFLNLVEKEVDNAGYKYTRLDGTMKADERDEALQALDQDDDCTIMLASLGVCAVGLNLVAANNIILSDSWWSPAVEDQAVDRVHRLGQKRATKVFRLVMDKTIEDTVLEIQQQKRALMKMALSEKSSKRDAVKQGRVADIQKLLGWK